MTGKGYIGMKAAIIGNISFLTAPPRSAVKKIGVYKRHSYML